MRKLFTFVLALVTGVFPAFFIVFNSVFSDSSGSAGERLITFLLTAAAFGILGALFGYFSPSNQLLSGIALSIPAAFILIIYAFKEPGVILLSTVYLAITVFFACTASHYGARLKLGRRP